MAQVVVTQDIFERLDRKLQAFIWQRQASGVSDNYTGVGLASPAQEVGMGQAQKSQADPTAAPTLVLLPDFAWQFSPCPTDQQMSAFLNVLQQHFQDVRSMPCTKIGPHPRLGARGLVEVQRVGIWTSPVPPFPGASAARDNGLRDMEFLTGIPPTGSTFAYFVNMVGLDALIRKSWDNYPKRFGSDGQPDPNGPVHLTGFSYSFQSPDPPVVVTRIDGFDTDTETRLGPITLTPALDFNATITDAISATGGIALQCQSSRDVHTNYPDWVTKVLAILAVLVPVLLENIALAFAAYLGFGGSVPGGPPVSGGVGCTIAQPPPVGVFPGSILISIHQPLVNFNYEHVNVGYGPSVPAGGLFAGGSAAWLL